MESSERREMLDLMATAAAAVVLLGMGFWNHMTISRLPSYQEMFAAMDSGALPLLSRLVFQIGELHLFHVLSVILLLLGFALLFTTRDRFRGIVYSIVVSLLIAVITVIVKEAAWLPMMKIIQSVSL